MLEKKDFAENPDLVEEIERRSVQLVAHAIKSHLSIISQSFDSSSDLHKYLHENPSDEIENKSEALTEAALDELGLVDTDPSLMTSIDHKRTRYVSGDDYVAKQLLLVDSKAEKEDNQRARMQLTQTSLNVRQVRWNEEQDRVGDLPAVVQNSEEDILTTTVLVKYVYQENGGGDVSFDEVIVACVPNGLLQNRYNPDVSDNIWNAGPNGRDEKFRTRLRFDKLENKDSARVHRFSL